MWGEPDTQQLLLRGFSTLDAAQPYRRELARDFLNRVPWISWQNFIRAYKGFPKEFLYSIWHEICNLRLHGISQDDLMHQKDIIVQYCKNPKEYAAVVKQFGKPGGIILIHGAHAHDRETISADLSWKEIHNADDLNFYLQPRVQKSLPASGAMGRIKLHNIEQICPRKVFGAEALLRLNDFIKNIDKAASQGFPFIIVPTNVHNPTKDLHPNLVPHIHCVLPLHCLVDPRATDTGTDT